MAPPWYERRVLVLAPVGRDTELTRTVLAEAGIRSTACAGLPEMVGELGAGAGALLLSEEALASEIELHFLGDHLMRQPSWSDLPILLLARHGADSAAVRKAVRALGNVTLLERPVRVASLVTAAQAALRARQRQYDAREHLMELDQVARRLAQSESRLQAVFANAAVGIGELDADGRFALVNDALCRLLGERRESLLCRALFDHVHAEDREDLSAVFADVLAGRRAGFAGERRLVRSDGEAIWVKLSVTPAREPSQPGPARAVAVIEDVTERKLAEDDLREADRRKDEFLATLAHELRNPLAPIRNSLHIFRLGGAQDPTLAKVTAMVDRQVQHMVRIVDDLMEVSRVSRGKIELRRERVELGAIVRSAVDTSMPLIDAGKHRLLLDVPDQPLVIEADAVRLTQVFSNLLNNAAKYTPEGGRIEVKVAVEGGMAVVCVKDDGEGIPPSMLGRVFQMFTQLETGRRAQGGLGIGLTLARTLVSLHGGSIEASSEGLGKGCEFVARLPLAVAVPQAHAPAEGGAHALEAQAAAPPGALTRVLVVDDNHDAADSLGLLLRLLGAEAMVVHDGRAALEALKAFEPAVVLLDLGMPGMSGLEVARRMRENPAFARTTLVALTGWGQHDDRRRTREAGFDFHLVKPADVGTLRSILAHHDARPEAMTQH